MLILNNDYYHASDVATVQRNVYAEKLVYGNCQSEIIIMIITDVKIILTVWAFVEHKSLDVGSFWPSKIQAEIKLFFNGFNGMFR